MQAAYITRTGPPDVIEYGELPTPQPGPREVLVKIGAAALNPIDTYIRSGLVGMAQKFPYIPGCDLAGTVQTVGAEVGDLRPGQRVWGSNQSLFGRQGTFAQFAAVEEKWLYPTPDHVTDAQAAAGALVGITAHLGLFRCAALKPGEIVFVNGGAGGVGSSVVQVAKSTGAKVVTTAGSDEKRKLCSSWGADLVLDYRAADLDDRIRAFAQPAGGVHVWFETQREPTLDRTVGLMAPRGRIVLMAGRQARPEFPVGPFYVKDLSLLGFAMFNATAEEQQTCAAVLNQLLATARWRPLVGRTFPLEQAAAAHQLQEQNTLEKQGTLTGKIVVVP